MIERIKIDGNVYRPRWSVNTDLVEADGTPQKMQDTFIVWVPEDRFGMTKPDAPITVVE